jgi:hypothetical protein
MSHSRAVVRSVAAPSALEVLPWTQPQPSGAERRTERRFTSRELRNRLVARHKYGESVTLIDLSAGGVQFETPRLIRPDVDVVLEIINSRTQEVAQVISRVLRANVSGLAGGIRYRAAASFRHPLSDPALLQPTVAPERSGSPDYLKLEHELKTIVETYLKRPRAGMTGRRDPSSLLDALAHLRSAAERRRDPADRQLGALLATLIPALQRREPAEAVLRQLHARLGEELPLIAIRANAADDTFVHDCERITLNMGVDGSAAPMAITAEFPEGFGLDASQFRLLKMSAYLVGLIANVNSLETAQVPAASASRQPQPALPSADATQAEAWDALPLGWHRVVVRYIDGQLLHGYSNDFYPDRPFIQFSPTIGCSASERMLIPIGRLKAVFFVKDLQGDSNRLDRQTFDHRPRGRKIQVTFRDGEVLTGSTLSYKPDGQGFFVIPASTRANNIRVYVVATAIKHLRFV